jgi:hypothetical protein
MRRLLPLMLLAALALVPNAQAAGVDETCELTATASTPTP